MKKIEWWHELQNILGALWYLVDLCFRMLLLVVIIDFTNSAVLGWFGFFWALYPVYREIRNHIRREQIRKMVKK